MSNRNKNELISYELPKLPINFYLQWTKIDLNYFFYKIKRVFFTKSKEFLYKFNYSQKNRNWYIFGVLAI